MNTRAFLLLSFLFFLSVSDKDLQAQSNPDNWREVNLSDIVSYEYVYGGAGEYYTEPLLLRTDEKIVFYFGIFFYSDIQIKIDGIHSNWVSLYSGNGAYGEQLFDPNWPSTGTYTLRMRWRENPAYDWNDDTWWTVTVVNQAQKIFKDNYGNHLTLWDSDGVITDPIIVVEGFDPINTNNENIYFYGGIEFFAPAIADGRDVLVLQFNNGGADMLTNKNYVENAIKYINSIKTGSNPNVLVGVSMGGVIARYVLAESEATNDLLNVSHFISLDGPQQGAVVDKGFLDFIEDQPGSDNPSLSSIAAKQLLKYNPYVVEDQPNYVYSTFYTSLNNLNGDGYPNQTKNIGVAFSNPVASQTSGKWLTIDVEPNIPVLTIDDDQHFYKDVGEDIYNYGSWLPISTTRIWGRAGYGLQWSAERYSVEPTFIEHKSALDLDSNGNSKFDQIIHSASSGYHDEIPNDIILSLLLALDIDIQYLNSSITSTHTATIEGSVSIPSNKTYVFTGQTIVKPGSTITLGTNSKIIFKGGVSAIGTQANPIVFKSADPNNASVQYDQVLFQNDWNNDSIELQWCIFEGGFYNARFEQVYHANIKNSTFKKGSVGIYAYDIFQVDFDDILVSDNTSYGIINNSSWISLTDSRIESNGNAGVISIGIATFNNSIVTDIRRSIIQNNSSYGIYVKNNSDLDLIDSRVINNGGHEIYAYSDADLNLGVSGSSYYYYGENSISDNIEGFGTGKRYIYKSTLTSNGENQTSPTTRAEKNYWGYYYPQGGIFYGSVDPYPYLSSDPTIGLNPSSYPMVVDNSGGPGLIQASTAAINQAVVDKNSDDDDGEALKLKTRLLELRNSFTEEQDILKKVALLKSLRASAKPDISEVANGREELISLEAELYKELENTSQTSYQKPKYREINKAEER